MREEAESGEFLIGWAYMSGKAREETLAIPPVARHPISNAYSVSSMLYVSTALSTAPWVDPDFHNVCFSLLGIPADYLLARR